MDSTKYSYDMSEIKEQINSIKSDMARITDNIKRQNVGILNNTYEIENLENKFNELILSRDNHKYVESVIDLYAKGYNKKSMSEILKIDPEYIANVVSNIEFFDNMNIGTYTIKNVKLSEIYNMNILKNRVNYFDITNNSKIINVKFRLNIKDITKHSFLFFTLPCKTSQIISNDEVKIYIKTKDSKENITCSVIKNSRDICIHISDNNKYYFIDIDIFVDYSN